MLRSPQLFRHPGLYFSLFVFWLLSLPMGGPLLASVTGADSPGLFLLPHILTLVLAYRVSEFWRKKIYLIAVSGCVAGTILPLISLNGFWLLAMIGICSAFISVHICQQLTKANSPVAAAALGLVFGNLLLYLMVSLQAPQWLHTLIATLAIMAMAIIGSSPQIKPRALHLTPYLLCLLVFHLTSGVMYSYVLPHYTRVAFAPGIELLFYLLAIPLAYFLLRFGHDTLLIAAIGLSMFAFAMLIETKPTYLILSMFSLQASAGFSDLFVLAWIINSGGGIKAFGYALGSVCSGILIGEYLGQPTTAIFPGVVLFGNLALSLTMLGFYLFKKKELTHTREGLQGDFSPGNPSQQNQATTVIPIPSSITCALSSREQLVLERVLRGETYLNIAGQLNVTESTIKTYMRRIRQKTGTTNKKELLLQIARKQ